MNRFKHDSQPHWPIRMTFLLVAILSLLWVLTACQPVATESFTRLKLAGSTTVAPAAADAAQTFMTQHSDVEVTVRGGGSSIGVLGVSYGSLQIGMVSRALKASELAEFPDLTATVIGRDGVAVVINRAVYENGVEQLTMAQVRDIWSGKITNWQDVGGPDLPILVFDKEKGRGTRDTFAKIVLGDEDADAPGAAGVLGENDTVITAVNENEGAVSMLSTGWLTDEVIGVAIVNQNGQAIQPSLENVASGKYPITRDLSLITNGPAEGTAADFIHFMLTSNGQIFISQNGYTPILQ